MPFRRSTEPFSKANHPSDASMPFGDHAHTCGRDYDRPMADARLRDLERRWRASGSAQDEAAWLAARVQAGDLPAERLSLAALLGHEAALLAGGTPLPDPFAGRDQAAWSFVDLFVQTRDPAALVFLVRDPPRHPPCPHSDAALPVPLRPVRLVDVAYDPDRDVSYTVLRCWPCGERILFRPLRVARFSLLGGTPHWLRGAALLDHLVHVGEREAEASARGIASRRWAWGLEAHPVEASLRAAHATVKLALERRAPEWRDEDPGRQLAEPTEFRAKAALRILDAIERWILHPTPETASQVLEADAREERKSWVDDLVDAAKAPAELRGSIARSGIHLACSMVRPEGAVYSAVRAALVPWALGYSDPLRA